MSNQNTQNSITKNVQMSQKQMLEEKRGRGRKESAKHTCSKCRGVFLRFMTDIEPQNQEIQQT